MFSPRTVRKDAWCNLIKRRENKDGFRISKSTRVFENHFLPENIYGPPGGTRKRLIQGARPVLHPWNNFTFIEKHRKEPLRRSPRKKGKVADCSEQQYDVQQDLFEPDDNIHLDDSPVDFEKTTKDVIDKSSQTDDLDNTLKVELKRLKHLVKELRESYSKNMRSHFTDHVIFSNELCNHYTGFPSVDVLNAVFEYLDPGVNSENVILYNYQKIKNDSSAGGRPRKLDP